MNTKFHWGVTLLSDALYRSPGVVKSGQELLSSRSDAPHRHPDVVLNEHGFPHFYERVRVKKLANEYRIRLASWNIGSLTGRLTELVDAMVRRDVSILCAGN